MSNSFLHQECTAPPVSSSTSAADIKTLKPNIIMKHLLILIIGLLLFSPAAHAGWFSKDTEILNEAKERIGVLESRLSAQSIILDNWRIAAGSLAVGCAFLLIIGAALGSKTRQHFYESARRMGGSTPPASLNGRNPTMGQATETNVHTTLAA